MCHRSVKTLLYCDFILCLVHSDYSRLIIQGLPSEDDLKDCWDLITQEYSELIKTDKSKSISELYKKICYLNWKRDAIKQSLKFLKREGYDKDIAEWVCLQGYNLIENFEDRDLYLKQIYFIELEIKNINVILNQLWIEYKNMLPKDDEPKIKRTEMDYEEELAFLSTWYGSRIDKKTFTVFEVCGIINSYIKQKKLNASSSRRTTV